MSRYAVVDDNKVSSVVDLLTDEEVVLYSRNHQNVIDVSNDPNVAAGWLLVGNKLQPAPDSATGSYKITRLAFRSRFTMAEKAALYTVAATPQGVALKVYIDDLAAASYVDLARPDTIASVNYLAYLGIITAPRAAEILNQTILPQERYHE